MKRMLFVFAAFVLMSSGAARGDAVAWDGETSPLVLTNVTLQIWGDAELREEIPQDGLLFLREDGEVYVGDGVTPGGRPVCKGTPDWHVFHKALEVNGNEIKLNSTLSEQASGAKLTWTADGEKVFWILSADEAEGGQSSWERLTARMTNGYLLLTAYTTNENAVVLSTTNLLSITSWAPCTNAVLEAYTATSRTWRITQQAQTEFYRVLKDVPITKAGIYAELPLVALKGVTMDGVTVSNWAQITDAIAAVSNRVEEHAADTNNPHSVTAAQLGALTSESDPLALAAVNTASNALAIRIGAAETNAQDFATMDWVVEQGYLTEHQSLEDYAKTEDVAAATNALSAKFAGVYATSSTVASVERRLGVLETTTAAWSSEVWTFILTNGTTVNKRVLVEAAP